MKMLNQPLFTVAWARLLYTLLVVPGIALSAQSQTPTKSISITEVLAQVMNGSDTSSATGDFSDLVVSFDIPGEDIFEYLRAKFPDAVNRAGNVQFAKGLAFDRCQIKGDLDLKMLALPSLRLSETSVNQVTIVDCTLGELQLSSNRVAHSIEVTGSRMTSLEIKGNTVDYEIYMEVDSILGDAFIESNVFGDGELVIIEDYFNGSFTLGNNQVAGILIESSTFNLPHFGEFNNYKLPGNEPNDLYLTGNTFSGDSTTHVYFNRGSYLNLDIRKNRFNCDVFFIENNINDRFFLVDNEFMNQVSFEKFLFSETWNELYWKQLAGYKLRFVDYAGISPGELRNEVEFKNLINIYKGLHTIFLSRGDLESANACYSEMKQLQGRKLKQVYLDEGGFGNFLRWQLNVLLKIYTNHGTDPGLAVVMSFVVILAFSVLYLFFPSEWDSDSLNRLMISYEKFLHHENNRRLVPMFVVLGSVLLTLINAVTLSINSFVTLGFGSIPTKGFARYLCIIEGFLGWFLLSIFTVALINQVLA
ncbi:MAG: hypothetical protein AB7K37_09910 [Cyclobacteriaceae bacterium]